VLEERLEITTAQQVVQLHLAHHFKQQVVEVVLDLLPIVHPCHMLRLVVRAELALTVILMLAVNQVALDGLAKVMELLVMAAQVSMVVAQWDLTLIQ
jgi:hypothetical protein